MINLSDDISGNGAVVIDGTQGETVYYWLTIVPKPVSLIAEGSISDIRHVMAGFVPAMTIGGKTDAPNAQHDRQMRLP
jgi:hypothetical protein